ncbi:MAG: 1,4-dihydroxy-2-naphthoate octaprenyltransferase [Woeseiaceae bacterium]|nr:1,4-dihydroxy-2-naphthoate octaprenyltransferase [Woeseiaceae bacterium]MDX2608787.1 1,4-dihydroxy-2-naphthoate octaprenyltransferase [Woeseiaceae bacterium]
MSSENLEVVEPSVQQFAGRSFSQTAKRLFHATRPKFFPASAFSVVIGTAWGVQATGGFSASVFALALLATVCVHAASNVLNDVGDDSGGTDRQNKDRIYPYTGGSQFIQKGIMSAPEMARLGISLLTVAAIAGLVLIILKGPVVLYFGLVGVALAVLYSLGPAHLSSLGVGETAVAIGFGIVPVVGAAWLQGAPLDSTLLIVSLPTSIWVAMILLANEVPDIAADGATGKRTLPVRLGLTATAFIYVISHIGAAMAIAWLAYTGALPLIAPLVPAGLLVLAFRGGIAIKKGVEYRSSMRRAIEGTLAIHTVGSLWFCACILYMHWWPAT